MRKFFNSRLAAVAVGATILTVAAGTGGAVAGAMVTSEDIKNQSIESWDIAHNGVGKSEVRRDSVGWYGELNEFTRNKITDLAGKDGAQGPQGPEGPQGPQGPQGDPASDVLGGLAADEQFVGNIASIGGSFADRATELGSFELEPGTYLVSSDGFFITNDATSGGTRMQLAIRGMDGSKWGVDYGTCFTNLISTLEKREATCNTTRAVEVAETTTVKVYGFGYADDQGSADSGKVDAAAFVSAVRVG
jgi:hypothetical protein